MKKGKELRDLLFYLHFRVIYDKEEHALRDSLTDAMRETTFKVGSFDSEPDDVASELPRFKGMYIFVLLFCLLQTIDTGTLTSHLDCFFMFPRVPDI